MTASRSNSSLHCQPCLDGYNRSKESAAASDSSLTSLNWLHNLRVLDIFSLPDGTPYVTPISPSCEDSEDSFSWTSSTSCASSRDGKKCHSEYGISLSPLRRCLVQSAEFCSCPKKYRNSTQKPPFCYSTLIYLAIKFSSTGQATLNEIYRWIKEHFKYYRTAESSWQNSIRHNLSLNEFFIKVPKKSGTAGKGSYWKLNPDYEILLSGNGKRLDLHHSCSYKAKHHKKAHLSCNQRKSTSASLSDTCGLHGDLDWISLLGSQRLSCGLSPTQSCKPFLGSPVLASTDMSHATEPLMCSPLVVPCSLANEPSDISDTPFTGGDNHGALLEEVVLKQDSPSPLLLPWAETHSLSPNLGHPHPWAESKEITLHQMRSLISTSHQMWSPESNWSASCSLNCGKKAPLFSETCIY